MICVKLPLSCQQSIYATIQTLSLSSIHPSIRLFMRYSCTYCVDFIMCNWLKILPGCNKTMFVGHELALPKSNGKLDYPNPIFCKVSFIFYILVYGKLHTDRWLSKIYSSWYFTRYSKTLHSKRSYTAKPGKYNVFQIVLQIIELLKTN